MMMKQSGVTLMELLIVVVVIGILTAIAYPSYRAQVVRSNRAEGKAALMHASQEMERCYTRSSTFVGCLTLPITTEGGRYQITNGGETPTSTTYRLRATPQGGQTQDAQCGYLQVTHTGARTSENGTAAECWQR